MKTLKIFVMALMFGIISIFGSEIGEQLSIPGAEKVVPSVEARIGRPLTPVSFAGAARRTARRCAVGVYNCSFEGFQSMDNLLGQINSESIYVKKNQPISNG
jgi:hypothetical protein